MTYGAIGRKVGLGERQVQRIVREMEHQREEEIVALQRQQEPRRSDQRDRERAEELVEHIVREARTALSLARQSEPRLQNALVLGMTRRGLERARVELLEILAAMDGAGR
jgi:hypothetical protein